MTTSLPGQQNYFEAFIKAAQYLAGLTAQQDIWSETGKVLVNFFGADVGAVEERRADGEAAGRRWAFSERYSGRRDLEAETGGAIAEVLESGFLSARIILTPHPLSIACFPITRENQVVAVMVVGHGMPGPLPRKLLNVHLAVAGLVGTIGERLASERELRRHRRQLEEEIAERKQAEEALRRAHEELEMRVIERTSELKNANEHLELEIAERKRAEAGLSLRSQELARSNADLEQFAYVASHDLQEPLRMVASYLQLLEERYSDKLDSDAHEFIGFAVDGARRMQVLIADLLAYSRIGTRGQSFQPVNCEQVLEKAMINLHIAIQESGAQITHPPLPTVWGDAMQLTQLFQNLIGNAIKFRRDRPPEICIRAEPEEDCWRFSVRDNGIGIEPQHFERIFMVFQRLHSRSAYPGTGIGLAICKKIVERHGGAIWVESEPGQGATFYFTIPKKGGPL